MSPCPVCGDRGLVKVCYQDEKDPETTCDFAICLCAVGQRFRRQSELKPDGPFPLWRFWAAENGIDEARIDMLEEFYDDEELRARFGFVLTEQGVSTEALIRAGHTKARRPRL